MLHGRRRFATRLTSISGPLYGFESHLLRQAILIPNGFLAVSISSLHQAYNRMVAMTVGSGGFPF